MEVEKKVLDGSETKAESDHQEYAELRAIPKMAGNFRQGGATADQILARNRLAALLPKRSPPLAFSALSRTAAALADKEAAAYEDEDYYYYDYHVPVGPANDKPALTTALSRPANEKLALPKAIGSRRLGVGFSGNRPQSSRFLDYGLNPGRIFLLRPLFPEFYVLG
jgi:hypothetical protein